MGRKGPYKPRIDMEAGLKLLERYGLRACEVLEIQSIDHRRMPFKRFVSADRKSSTITILGKAVQHTGGGFKPKIRTVHILPEDFDEIVEWYQREKKPTYHAIYYRMRNHLKHYKKYPDRQLNTVTHIGRKKSDMKTCRKM